MHLPNRFPINFFEKNPFLATPYPHYFFLSVSQLPVFNVKLVTRPPAGFITSFGKCTPALNYESTIFFVYSFQTRSTMVSSGENVLKPLNKMKYFDNRRGKHTNGQTI